MKCLIVDDDPCMTFVLSECIKDLGHEAIAATTVKDATKAMRAGKFDLILLDYVLPDGTSADLSTLAAVTQPNCRVILITGSPAFPQGENTHLAPGIDWVLRKPAAPDDIAALIEYAAHDAAWHPTAAYALP